MNYKPAPNERYKYVRHPARCNKRSCQARRNLSKHPALYEKWPTCHCPGCDGKMYVDWYRMKKGPKDRAEICKDPNCILKMKLPYHRVDHHGCSQYQNYVTKRNTSPRSKHSPIPIEQWVPF